MARTVPARGFAEMISRALILVVDDDTAVLNSFGFMLETEGFEVRAFSDIGELPHADSIRGANCLVVDYLMPTMNGFGVLRSLRRRQITAPPIVLTGSSDKTFVGRGVAAGFARVVEKPDLEDELVRAIRELTAQVGESGDRPGDSTMENSLGTNP
jgi:FixJ family two-component response regulator